MKLMRATPIDMISTQMPMTTNNAVFAVYDKANYGPDDPDEAVSDC